MTGSNAVTLDVGKGTWSLEHREGIVMDSDKTEHIKEAARVLSRYVAAIGVRAFPEMKDYDAEMTDPVVRGFAEYSDAPVFNLESSRHHPFQALADAMTIRGNLASCRISRRASWLSPQALRWPCPTHSR